MTQPQTGEGDNLDSDALEIANERNAQGELSEKEFERINSNIISSK